MVSSGGYPTEAREFREHFGDTDSIAVLLVVADDVTTLPVLEYVHAISLHFAGEPSVERVQSLTVTPLPGAASAGSAEALEDLGDLEFV